MEELLLATLPQGYFVLPFVSGLINGDKITYIKYPKFMFEPSLYFTSKIPDKKIKTLLNDLINKDQDAKRTRSIFQHIEIIRAVSQKLDLTAIVIADRIEKYGLLPEKVIDNLKFLYSQPNLRMWQYKDHKNIRKFDDTYQKLKRGNVSDVWELYELLPVIVEKFPQQIETALSILLNELNKHIDRDEEEAYYSHNETKQFIMRSITELTMNNTIKAQPLADIARILEKYNMSAMLNEMLRNSIDKEKFENVETLERLGAKYDFEDYKSLMKRLIGYHTSKMSAKSLQEDMYKYTRDGEVSMNDMVYYIYTHFPGLEVSKQVRKTFTLMCVARSLTI